MARPATPAGSMIRREVITGLRGQGLVPGGFPVPGQQLVHPGMCHLGDAGQYIAEPGLRVDVVELVGDDEGEAEIPPLLPLSRNTSLSLSSPLGVMSKLTLPRGASRVSDFTVPGVIRCRRGAPDRECDDLLWPAASSRSGRLVAPARARSF